MSILALAGCSDGTKAKVEQTKAQVNEIMEALDTKIDKATGLYLHENVEATDAWGHQIKVTYNQRNNYETLTVRSAGPDGTMFNKDDIVIASRWYKVGAGSEDAKKILRDATSGVKEGLKTPRTNPNPEGK
jgi:hypothetical protein